MHTPQQTGVSSGAREGQTAPAQLVTPFVSPLNNTLGHRFSVAYIVVISVLEI